ncbi:MAG: ribonuclease P protein component [Candidatus Gastranaerophilales bacterium]|nr:ribonuclease P protein component [Candidatus Gastranaerophilales bacterium]
MLPKQQRLIKSSAFKATYRLKQSTADALLVLCAGKIKTAQAPTKVGFVVSKKIHKRAVKRNRIKRLTREAYRLAIKNGDINPKWMSLIFTAREASLNADFKQVYNSVIKLIQKMEKKLSNETNSNLAH